MKFFSLWPTDQKQASWVLCVIERISISRNKRAGAIPAAVHSLLGQPAGDGLRMKPQYQRLRCGTCRRYDSDEAFKVGFDEEATIKIKGNFGPTNDRIMLIDDKFLSALKSGGVKGFDSKPIGHTGWHAFRVNHFVSSNDAVIKTAGARCPECGRPEESWGVHQRLSDLSLPSGTKTFFTTKCGWPSSPFLDRETFLTEDIVDLLKEAGIAGGYCHRLWTEEEGRKYDENRRNGVDKYPPGTTVYLSGSRPKSPR
jgi:hypothetical protein